MRLKLYLAGLASNQVMSKWVIENFPAIGVLVSFAFPETVTKAIGYGFSSVMLDSGAFSVKNSNTKIDINAYIDFIKENKDHLAVAVSLDVLDDYKRSIENWDYITSAGVTTMPVYHYCEPIWVLDYYVKNADYVGLSVVNESSMKNWREIFPMVKRTFSRYPDKKYHIFGMTIPRVITSFPTYSCDALTWRNGSRFSQVITPYGRWHLNYKRGHKVNYVELLASGIFEYLECKYGIKKEWYDDKDFDWKTIDMVNIAELYEMLVKGAHENISTDIGLAEQAHFM